MTLRHNTPAVSLAFLEELLECVMKVDRINRIYKEKGSPVSDHGNTFL